MFDCSSVASTNIRLLNKTGEFVEKDLNNRIDSRCLSNSFFFRTRKAHGARERESRSVDEWRPNQRMLMEHVVPINEGTCLPTDRIGLQYDDRRCY